MAQLNKLQFNVTDNQGNPLSGVSVTVHLQGATVNGSQAGPAYTVNDPGAIVIGNDVYSSINQSFTKTVSAVTATSVTPGAVGLGSLADDDRILIALAKPILYNDAQAAESKANPLTTDASGTAYCWVQSSKFDIMYVKSGYATRFEFDRVAEGIETNVSNVFTAAGAVGFMFDTSRSLTTAGAKLISVRNSAQEKFYIDKDGDIGASGDVLITGTLGVTGATTLTTLTATTGTFSSTLTASNGFTLSSGTLSLPAGSVETADLATNAVVQTRTADGTADQTYAAAAYNTANYVDLTNATVTYTPFASASEHVIVAKFAVEANAAGVATVFGAIRDGANTILAEGGWLTGASVGNPTTATLTYRVTALTGSQTFKMSWQSVTNNTRTQDSTNAATKRVNRIIAMEFKK